MAGIEERSGSDRIHFRYPAKPDNLTVAKVSEDEGRSKSDKFAGFRLRSPLRGEVGDRYGVPWTRSETDMASPEHRRVHCGADSWRKHVDRHGTVHRLTD